MSLKDILPFVGLIILNKAVEDNLPSFKYQTVLASTKKAIRYFKAIGIITYMSIAWQLDKNGIIKMSPQLKNSVAIALVIALLMKLLSKLEITKLTPQPVVSLSLPRRLTLNR
jgi:hypothetical protein